MGLKSNKCCCCPICTESNDLCCRCVCQSLCVTIDPPNADPCSTELDWNTTTKTYSGSLSCDGETIDLLFYFERDADGCWFVLCSDRLNFGTGTGSAFVGSTTGTGTDEQCKRWLVGTDIECDTLSQSVETDLGTLSFECVTKITPTTCNTCLCLCECICVEVTTDEYTCGGKACWNENEQCYTGSLDCFFTTGTSSDLFTLPVTVCIFPELGTGSGTGTGTLACWLRVEVDGKYAETELTDCEGRNLNYTLNLIEIGGVGSASVGTVTIRCALCNELCEQTFTFEDCPCPELPRRWDFTVSVLSGPALTCTPSSGIVSLESAIVPTWHNGPTLADSTVRVQCISRTWSCVCVDSEGAYSAFGWEVSYNGNSTTPLSQDSFGRCWNDPDFEGFDNNGYCMCDPKYIQAVFLNTVCGGVGDGLIMVEFTPH